LDYSLDEAMKLDEDGVNLVRLAQAVTAILDQPKLDVG